MNVFLNHREKAGLKIENSAIGCRDLGDFSKTILPRIALLGKALLKKVIPGGEAAVARGPQERFVLGFAAIPTLPIW